MTGSVARFRVSSEDNLAALRRGIPRQGLEALRSGRLQPCFKLWVRIRQPALRPVLGGPVSRAEQRLARCLARLDACPVSERRERKDEPLAELSQANIGD